MGIPAYFSYLLKNYKSAATTAPVATAALLMDCNSIVYDAYHKMTAAGEQINSHAIIKRVISIIEHYINFIKPSKTVFIAFDGVAPFAKMMQQRSRRWRTAVEAGAAARRDGVWSTLEITPGTPFMNLLTFEIERHFESAPSIIVSGSNVRGEGEHKIFEYMRTHIINENVVIYGLDADLIMLSLNHCHKNQITIFREAFVAPAAAAAAPPPPQEPYTFVDINYLSKQIWDVCHATPADYIFVCFLLGNDFLPHFPALNLRKNGMDILLQTYNYLGSPPLISAAGKIQWRNVRAVLVQIAKREHEIIAEDDKTREKISQRLLHTKLTPEERSLNRPLLYREYEKYICPQEVGWETRYYRVLFGPEADDESQFGAGEEIATEYIRGICLNYLEGLEWTMKYYGGFCPHWKWSYKYHYPPLLVDLIRYIPYFETEFFAAAAAAAAQKSYSERTQLAAVMPPPPEVMAGLPAPRLIWCYCRYDWEAHIDLPEITTRDMDELEAAAAAATPI
jgi:5'-3' exonuclease